MFNLRRTQNSIDTSLFDPEHDMDLVALINEARTEHEIQSVARMNRARMRARRQQIASARRPRAAESTRGRAYAPPASAMRGI